MKLPGSYKGYLDLKLIALLTVFYTLFEIIHIFKLSYFLGQNNLPWPDYVVGVYLIDWVLVISFMTFTAVLTRYLIQKNVSWSRIFLLHFIFSILISFLIRIAIEFYQARATGKNIKDLNMQELELGLMANIDVNFLIYFAMIFIIYSYFYQKEIRTTEAQKGSLEAQLLTTRMKMLTTQLQPHFLFNILNGISSLIQIDQKKAQDTLADLSDFLREILYHSDSGFTTVRNELNLLEKYTSLLRTKFWDQLNIETKIAPSVLDKEMPSMLLQPIIENATKHGFSLEKNRLNIYISVLPDNGFIDFIIQNDGKRLEDIREQENRGVGLSNIKARLQNIYGDKFLFSLKNDPDGPGVTCHVRIPDKKRNSAVKSGTGGYGSNL